MLSADTHLGTCLGRCDGSHCIGECGARLRQVHPREEPMHAVVVQQCAPHSSGRQDVGIPSPIVPQWVALGCDDGGGREAGMRRRLHRRDTKVRSQCGLTIAEISVGEKVHDKLGEDVSLSMFPP